MTEYAQLETPEAVRAALERGEPVERFAADGRSWPVYAYAWNEERTAYYISRGYKFRAPLPAVQASDACASDADWRTSGLIEALKVRKQIDEDGTLIGVSHQALDEATKILEAIAAEPAPLSEKEKADRDLILIGTSFMVDGVRIDPARVTIERKAETREAVAEVFVPEPPSQGYVQAVPDKCDRITWRNHYYQLPINQAPPATPDLLARLGELADELRHESYAHRSEAMRGDVAGAGEEARLCAHKKVIAERIRDIIAGAQK